MSGGEAIAVGAAAAVLSAIVGILATWPLWRSSGHGPRFAPALLALHAGGVVIGGTVATAAAVRSWQLVGEPGTDRALLTVSRTDGDTSLYALFVLVLAIATALVTALLALSARFAASSHPVDRSIACAVIGLEIALAGVALAFLAGGSRSPVTLVAVAHLPVLMVALALTWPRAGTPHPAISSAG